MEQKNMRMRYIEAGKRVTDAMYGVPASVLKRYIPILMLLIMLAPAAAQDDDPIPEENFTCENAMQTIMARCEGMGSNQICYGAGEVDVSFQPGHPAFENPDRVRFLPGGAFLPSDAIASVKTDADRGLAMMNVEAQDGHSVTYVIQGDVEMVDLSADSSVAVDCSATPASNRMNIRPAPTTEQAAIGVLDFGDSLPVLGRLEDSTWYMVDMPGSEQNGWLFGEFITLSCAPEDIPVVSPEGEMINALRGYQPMQAFTLRTGADNLTCGGQVLAQSDGAIPIFVNDAVITLDGTAILRTDAENALVVESLAGSAQVAGGGVSHIAVPGTMVRVAIPPETAAEGTPVEMQPSIAAPFDPTQVADAPIQLLNQPLTIPAPHDVTVLRNPEAVSGVLPPGERLVYTLEAETGYYLTAYMGFQNPETAEPVRGTITLVSPIGYVVEIPSGPTLGLVDGRFSQRFPSWLLETGTYQVYVGGNNVEAMPFYLLIQGHDRRFCDRVIERTVGSNTFIMTYPFRGVAGEVVNLTVTADFRDDPTRPPFAIYDSVPQDGQLVQGTTILAMSDTNTLQFTVPKTSAYFVEVQVQPGSDFRLESACE